MCRVISASVKDVSVPDEFTFVAGGDMIGPYGTLKGVEEPTFKGVAALFKSGDLGYANQEGAIFDLASFSGYPSAETGGGYPVSPLAVAHDLRVMGINVVSKANNHSVDWGMEGLVASLKSLEAAGIAQAGGGISDAQARSPVYVQTPHGKAALISATSTFPPAAVAGPPVTRQSVASRPRPGVSPLRVRQIRLVSADRLTTLRKIAGPVCSPAGVKGDEVRISDQYFRASDAEGTTIEADPADKAAILTSIRDAKANAGFVAFTVHAHETAGDEDDMPPVDYEPMVLHRANEVPSPDDPRPAAFIQPLFHEAVDAGADAVIRTGPHAVNGVELYHGKPIFFGLGSLFLCFGGMRGYTAPSGQKKTFPEEWFETIIPICKYKRGKLNEVRLYPAEIESSKAQTDGVPHLASPEKASRILERVKALSARFGTTVSIEAGVGVIHP
jgi:poly-gamma-glutamate capsule biosynthesis protein CapA/YwtB (metallophosphatase superfamily)